MTKRATAVLCLLSAGSTLVAQQIESKASTLPTTPAATAAAAMAPVPEKPAMATGAAPAPNTLLDGTAIKLRLTENLTSASAKTGQKVAFEAVDEVDVDGLPVILKGAQGLATVTDAVPKKSLGRGGKLDVNIDSVRLIDGENAQLRAVQEAKGGGHVGAMTGAIVATSIIFFPAAPLFLFVHGKDITIPEGTVVTAFVQGDMKLDMARMVPAGIPAVGLTPRADAALASIMVDSSTPGADIEVDGSFMGNTPSSVSVTPGKHTITVKKKGFADWSRSMTVAGTGVKLMAELEAKP